MNKRKSFSANTALSLLFSVALFLFIITFSIALPIYCRPFYYAHIEPLNLSELSGFSANEIKTAYNEVLDYLTIPGKDFSIGVMEYSEEGKAHFADCKFLFSLNASVLLASALCLILLLVLRKTGKASPFMLGKHSAAFYSAICAVGIPLVIGGIASLDFNKAFMLFHTLFFSGKTNWMFDPRTDEIINVLPEEFFINCAILIGASILVFSLILLLTEKKRQKRRNNYGLEKIL